ncbi:bifunctional diaminohydroxyphosphoribosylaminopyrimidine deaminase/5-amino-6-(5-phosphoribosylamino)uracil reductase RibD [Lichenicoccus sp.]|uniref:bifunctional diaminohydroxyphosphoribosylaminopyrimidine deaminase/5-amino-6-(5-phosphoribosylamino)uracil reductase RibD n=1 Tax=Lichenicoccus sp. TaxID=2781899 RepID=UPI003D136BE6
MQRARVQLKSGTGIASAYAAAIAEAARFVGATAPNPPVGCAILDADGEILTVAAHHRAGAPHAEALALLQCEAAGSLSRAATAVITLEPCNHVGRTRPCTDALLASPIRDVWIGAGDPNPRVTGGGAARLCEAGLAVQVAPPDSPEGRDCLALIAPFTSFIRGLRPWITVKQALDAEGSMIPPAGARTFTAPLSLHLAHRLRRATDAIITGMGTVLADAPHFTVRHVADHADRRRIIAVLDRTGALPAAWRQEAQARGFRVATAPDLGGLMQLLLDEGVLWAMVEGGPRLLDILARASLWDDWLTIRHRPEGEDLVGIRARTAITPLRLVEGMPAAMTVEREAVCSPAS